VEIVAEPRAITVLVVDDEDDIRFLVRALLEREGIRVVDQALDGLDALIAVARLAPPPVPTVIVLDNMMPALSGLEVAAQIFKEIPEQRIILFSAYLTRQIIEEATAMGIAACVAKADVAQLPEIINRVADIELDLREEPASSESERTLPW
jgi:two-component system chemotaxis response regulator CheY/response regulator NasT